MFWRKLTCLGQKDETPTSTKETRSKKKVETNPYASRGLDKFQTVLAELESKRKKIMEEAGSSGIAMVKFKYKDKDDWIPIVVKLPKSEDEKEEREQEETPRSSTTTNFPLSLIKIEKKVTREVCMLKKGSSYQTYHNLAMMMVLSLMCLVFFGRTFAICCTSVGWYMVPINHHDEEEEELNHHGSPHMVRGRKHC